MLTKKQQLGGIGRSTIHRHVQALIKDGHLGRSAEKFAYELVAPEESMGSLPYFGEIVAGKPIDVSLDPRTINLARFFCGEGRYVLKVNGDSMIEEGIFDEDYVVVKKRQTAKPGAIIVALVRGSEATLKYYYPMDTGVVELRPANEQLKSHYYPADEVEIQGVLIGVFRDYQMAA